MKEYTFIDLFAGIGGFHQAIKKTINAKCVFASEIDNYAKKTYELNYGLMPDGDITKIHETNIPQHDFLCAGFPCQAFSISGKQKGFDDIRGTLFFEIIRIAKFHAPKIILLENVKNLINHDRGNTLKIIIETLEKIGYTVFYKVLNASNFGLPQSRERVYFVCFHHNLNISNFNFPDNLNKKTALIDILESNPQNVKYIERDDITIKTNIPILKTCNEVTLPNKPVQIGFLNKGGQGERIYSEFGHSITLSATGGGIGAKTGLYKIHNKIRKLTPRECARLQGFPENFSFIGPTSQLYKQFGNSVAINVLEEIIKKIIEVING